MRKDKQEEIEGNKQKGTNRSQEIAKAVSARDGEISEGEGRSVSRSRGPFHDSPARFRISEDRSGRERGEEGGEEEGRKEGRKGGKEERGRGSKGEEEGGRDGWTK